MSQPKILVCGATATEASACLAGIRQSGFEGHFEVLKTGIGPKKAAHTLAERINRGEKPRLILSSGFAGSWSDHLNVGQWILARRVTRDQSPIPETENTQLFAPEKLEGVLPATVCSVSEIYEKAPRMLLEKLNETALPIAVDMESFALAEIALQANIPFGVLRYITDSPTQSLPSFVRHFTDVATGRDTSGKISALLTGTQALLGELNQVAPFLKNGNRWRGELVQGWAKFAAELYLTN